jgi:hypothetical protein
MKNDKHQRHQRIIYTRVLERGVGKCVNYLNTNEECKKDNFLQLLSTIEKSIQKVTKVPLDNNYYKGLEELMGEILELQKKEFDCEEVSLMIHRQANSLQKLKRVKNSKKTKHKKDIFEDGN